MVFPQPVWLKLETMESGLLRLLSGESLSPGPFVDAEAGLAALFAPLHSPLPAAAASPLPASVVRTNRRPVSVPCSRLFNIEWPIINFEKSGVGYGYGPTIGSTGCLQRSGFSDVPQPQSLCSCLRRPHRQDFPHARVQVSQSLQ